jgi:hypothetical protein
MLVERWLDRQEQKKKFQSYLELVRHRVVLHKTRLRHQILKTVYLRD